MLSREIHAMAFDVRKHIYLNAKDSWISIGIVGIVVLYLIFDGLIYTLYSTEMGMLERLLGGDLYFIGTRAIVLCLFLIFGSHV